MVALSGRPKAVLMALRSEWTSAQPMVRLKGQMLAVLSVHCWAHSTALQKVMTLAAQKALWSVHLSGET
jgi:hypothetical protein